VAHALVRAGVPLGPALVPTLGFPRGATCREARNGSANRKSRRRTHSCVRHAGIARLFRDRPLGPVTKQLWQPLSNVRGSDALSEPRTLESGCRRLDWLFPDRPLACPALRFLGRIRHLEAPWAAHRFRQPLVSLLVVDEHRLLDVPVQLPLQPHRDVAGLANHFGPPGDVHR